MKEIAAHEKRPYDRFLEEGPEALTEAELLAIIIRTGTASTDALGLAKQVLDLPKGLERGLVGLSRMSVEDLLTINGIGEVKAVKIKCITELSRRLAMAQAREQLIFTEPESVGKYYMHRMRYLESEQVLLAMLNNKNGLICDRVLSMGTVNASLVSPRELFITALEYRAVNVILVHNHPSGDTTPSAQDVELTRLIGGIGKLLKIQLLDHLIVGENGYLSMREAGYYMPDE